MYVESKINEQEIEKNKEIIRNKVQMTLATGGFLMLNIDDSPQLQYNEIYDPDI